MKVAIVIPTLNEGKTIGKLVDSLVKDPYPDKKIVVVDGGSTDDTVDIAKRHGATVLKEVGKYKCPANARNQGVKKSRAEIICFLDGDTNRVSRYFVTNAIRHFKDPSVIGVLCKTTFIHDTLVAKGLISVRDSSLTKFSARTLERCGQNFTFLRKEVFKELGGYSMLGVGEDVMLGRKLSDYLKANPTMKTINEPSSVLRMFLYSSFIEFLIQYIWYGRTKIPYLREARLNIIRKCILLLYPTAYLLSIASIPLVLVSPWFLIPASPYLIRLLLIFYGSVKNRDKHRLLTPLIDIINGIGHTIGLVQYLCGHRSLSRG